MACRSSPVSRAGGLRLPERLRDRIVAEARAAHPHEACGVLIGERDDASGVTRVDEALAAENVSEGDRRRRFLIAPEVLLPAQREALAAGREIVGYYHSQPESRPVPSAADRAAAWPEVSYLIVGVGGGEIGELRCWRLDPVAGTFVEERLAIDEPRARS